jgi:iron complex transport system substrate-binding protein
MLKKITAGVIAIVLIVIVSISAFATYSIFNPSGDSPPDDGGNSNIPNNPSNSNSTDPNNSNSQTLTYVDVTNRTVIVDLPVNRIIPMMAIDLVVAIGAEDKIVGRGDVDDEAAAFLGHSIMDIPVAGSVEMILELEPDLVLVGELSSAASVELLEEAGVPVIIDRTVRPRRAILIESLGIMLGVEETAQEFNDFEAHYENLVKDRVKDIPESEKPLVYFEFYMPGYSCGPGNSFHDLLIETGAINMAKQEIPLPILSSEYIIESNPDIIVRMLTYQDGLDLASFIALKDEMISRPGIDQVNAVKNDKVYIVKNTVIVTRETIGLLYYAKWFHPDLFTDIDPAAVHAEMVDKFYGTELQGVFTYP